jgi:hypothetical protein
VLLTEADQRIPKYSRWAETQRLADEVDFLPKGSAEPDAEWGLIPCSLGEGRGVG